MEKNTTLLGVFVFLAVLTCISLVYAEAGHGGPGLNCGNTCSECLSEADCDSSPVSGGCVWDILYNVPGAYPKCFDNSTISFSGTDQHYCYKDNDFDNYPLNVNFGIRTLDPNDCNMDCADFTAWGHESDRPSCDYYSTSPYNICKWVPNTMYSYCNAKGVYSPPYGGIDGLPICSDIKDQTTCNKLNGMYGSAAQCHWDSGYCVTSNPDPDPWVCDYYGSNCYYLPDGEFNCWTLGYPPNPISESGCNSIQGIVDSSGSITQICQFQQNTMPVCAVNASTHFGAFGSMLSPYMGPYDCDDSDNTVYPGAPELCGDGKDNDCDGSADCADSSCTGNPICLCGNGVLNPGEQCDGGSGCISPPNPLRCQCNTGFTPHTPLATYCDPVSTCSTFDLTYKRFYIQSSAGSNLLGVNQDGVMWLKGNKITSWAGSPVPGQYDFLIKDPSGNTKAWLQESTGNLYLAGNVFESSAAAPSLSGNFIIKDRFGADKAFFDSNGNLYLRGCLGTGRTIP